MVFAPFVFLGAALSGLASANMFKYSKEFHSNAPSHKLQARGTNSSTPVGPYNISTFEQYIDHNDQTQGTFQQSYWWNTEYWGGEGYPVILVAPQQKAMTQWGPAYFSNDSQRMGMAQEIGAAVITIEHRFFGNSTPTSDLSTSNLQTLTVKQNIADIIRFAENVQFPFSSTSQASAVPWILAGSEYSGAVTAWISQNYAGTFWAYFATSAPVEAINKMYQYLETTATFAPANCSASLGRVATYIDNTLKHGTSDEKTALKTQFGLESLTHSDDFAYALLEPLYQWQANDFYAQSLFFDFCDCIQDSASCPQNKQNSTIDIVVNKKPSTKRSDSTDVDVTAINGVSAEDALVGYAAFWEAQYGSMCVSYAYPEWTTSSDKGCWDSHNASNPMYLDSGNVNHVNRQWQWLLCNEPFVWAWTGAPTDTPTIASRLVTAKYHTNQCALYFPEENGTMSAVQAGQTPIDVNNWTGGWNMTNNNERVFFVNGQADPWLGATVSSPWRPEGAMVDTGNMRVLVIAGAASSQDVDLRNAQVNADVDAVVQEEYTQLVSWVAEWSSSATATATSTTLATTSATSTSTTLVTSVTTSTSTSATATSTSIY